ncbi:SOS response-associated peptidase [Actinoplanes sp. TFC3]|uniref:SOS response-associated peptidase n=1 Tax=Actinoplanes sp. TFC3 TaxID=1710355 RepID=UPI0009E6F5F5|nr:SOS response-associated peptidase [Actinoplanes sp. TFC3]
MCGRYATTRSEADLSRLFDAAPVAESLAPSWNVAPTEPVPLIRVSERHAGLVVDTARWGLLPPWAKDLRAGSRMINARAETVAGSPAFASSFEKRRCLIPADGWYEWVRTGKQRQAYYMTPLDGSVLAFAGIWTMWRGETMSCSVLTTAALGGLAAVHDRMPLVLPQQRWAGWLAGGGVAEELLQPMSPAELSVIEVRAVGAAVGNVRNNGPELTAPLAGSTASGATSTATPAASAAPVQVREGTLF